ncbi:hypothetical protein B7494_g3450 [Chlorociboria aeruginascens]|nr:hypothetical protein B7494_g3450 [Chlorociboria aeruginascens]
MSTASRNRTIFLTPAEDNRIRTTFKDKLKKCQDLAGKPRVSGEPGSSLNQVATASLLSDFSAVPEPRLKTIKSSTDAMITFAVGNPYLPCTAQLEVLQPMKLSELRMDTHHRGRVLTVRRVAPVVKLVALSWTIVQEDSSGETERLEIFLHKSSFGKEILELGSIFQIKEPYFTLSDQGDPTLRIDHPSDLVVSLDHLPTDSPNPSAKEVGDSKSLDSAISRIALTAKTAEDYKEEGNTALKQQDLQRAYTNYTQGLQLVTTNGSAKENLVHDLFRNRAYINLTLGRLDEAKSDALASLTGLENQQHKELDSKAYFRAGCAAYELGEFREAKCFFEEQQKLNHGNTNATASLRKIEVRLQEQATGMYNFKKIKAGLLMGRPRVEATSFTSNINIGESPGRGRGLFASRNLEPGDIILCEKAFCVVWGHEDEALTTLTYDNRDDRIRVFPAGLCRMIVQKLLNNPSQAMKVMDLYGDYRGLEKKLIIDETGPVIDTFQVHDIVTRNAFGPGPVYSNGRYEDEDARNASTGLWILTSYANHSCIPNAKKENIGDLMILRACRPVAAGEEITHSYDESSDYDARTTALMNTWGFTCTCALCIAEEADSAVLRKKRRDLESEASALIERSDAVRVDRLSISKAKRLARSIDATYDDERYKGLPRMAHLRIQNWLEEATSRKIAFNFLSMSDPVRRTVLVTGANGYIGNAVARAFVRAGWTTYGLVRRESAILPLAADEIIALLGSPADTGFLTSLNERNVVFDVIVSTTEQIMDYIPHYNEIISLLRTISRTNNATGLRPLVLFTSGCKDYGMMDKLADSEDLQPHTEESPLKPPSWAANRANYAAKIFENSDLFDSILLRPTNVYGLSSSFYSTFFKMGAEANIKGVLELTEDPRTILHAMHVDDCAEAYVALAEHPERSVVKGQSYNISGYRYETLDEIARALVKEYDIKGGVKYLPVEETPSSSEKLMMKVLIGFSQWTGSDKLRRETGWTDKRPLFSKALHLVNLETAIHLHLIESYWSPRPIAEAQAVDCVRRIRQWSESVETRGSIPHEIKTDEKWYIQCNIDDKRLDSEEGVGCIRPHEMVAL